MGWTDVLFGGLGKSTDPSQYAVASPQQGAINGMMGQQAAQVDPTQQAQFRQMQLQQAQQLQAVASGQQQGAGELAAQRQTQNAIAAQQAMARMARGGNAGLAYRQAASNTANVGLAGAGQAQQSAMQDQINAQQALMGSLNQGRQGDLSMGQTNAQLQQNQYGQNLGALTGLNGQQLQAQQNAMQATTSQQGILGGLLNTAGQVGAAYLMAPTGGGAGAAGAQASDENLKTDIHDAGGDIDEMLDKLTAKTYRYKDESKHGAGPRAGIMAQDLLRSKAGSALVTTIPDGLAFDVGKAVSAALASTARLNQRMRELEKRG